VAAAERFGEEIRGARVLVTGARGMLGSHLVPRLAERGARVFATSRAAAVDASDAVTWRQGEFRSRDALARLLDEIDPEVVYHLAGSVSGSPDLEHVLPSFHSLLESTLHLLELATRRGRPRLVLASSFLEPRPGDGEPRLTSGYAAAKWAASSYARMFHELYQTPVVTSVPFMVYGPHQQETKLVPHVARCLLEGRAPEIASPDYRADWVYAGDVADALVACGFEPRALGARIDLGTGLGIAVREVVAEIAAQIGGSAAPRYGAPRTDAAPTERVADPALARECLGWVPATPLRKGLAQTIDWMRTRLAGPSPRC
jgi:nucleoside-diphosphate-sugar epimerase